MMQCVPKCENCQRNYQLKDYRPFGKRIPLILPCGHTFCEGCLLKLVKDHTQLTCFSCRHVAQLQVAGKAGVRSLLPNIYLLGLLLYNKRVNTYNIAQGSVGLFNGNRNDIARQNTASLPQVETSDDITNVTDTQDISLLCEECTDSPASCQCNSCNNSIFCEACFSKVHSASKLLIKHKPLPIDHSNKESFCPIHNGRKLEFYDKNMGEAVCAICIISERCRGHDVVLLSDVTSDSEGELVTCVEKAKDVSFWLNYSTIELSKEVSNEHTEWNYLFSDINASFNACHTLLQKRHLELMLDAEQKLANRSVQQKLTEMLEKKVSLDVLLKTIETTMEDKCAVSFRCQEYLGRLKEFIDIPCIASKKEVSEDNHTMLIMAADIGDTIETIGSIAKKRDENFVYHKSCDVTNEIKEVMKKNFKENLQEQIYCCVKNEEDSRDTETPLEEPDIDQRLTCSLCEKTFSWKHDMNNDKTYSSKDELDHHIQSVHLSAARCPSAYTQRDQLDKHVLTEHASVSIGDISPNDMKTEPALELQCVDGTVNNLIEQENRVSSADKDMHIDIFSDASTIDYTTSSSLRNELLDVTPPGDDDIDTPQVPVSDMISTLLSLSTDEYLCNFCKESYGNKEDLQRHTAVHTRLTVKVKSSEAENVGRRCSPRGKHLGRPSRLTAARRTGYTCRICQKVFQSKANQLAHSKTHHSKKNKGSKGCQSFSCPLCKKSDMTKTGLAIHFGRKHKQYRKMITGNESTDASQYKYVRRFLKKSQIRLLHNNAEKLITSSPHRKRPKVGPTHCSASRSEKHPRRFLPLPDASVVTQTDSPAPVDPSGNTVVPKKVTVADAQQCKVLLCSTRIQEYIENEGRGATVKYFPTVLPQVSGKRSMKKRKGKYKSPLPKKVTRSQSTNKRVLRSADEPSNCR